MNKNEKLLRQVSKDGRDRITLVVSLIHNNQLDFLDIKKLSGLENIYRVRVGKFRIKFIKYDNFNQIIEITRRGDNTY